MIMSVSQGVAKDGHGKEVGAQPESFQKRAVTRQDVILKGGRNGGSKETEYPDHLGR
jgi:hypothetical protein